MNLINRAHKAYQQFEAEQSAFNTQEEKEKRLKMAMENFFAGLPEKVEKWISAVGGKTASIKLIYEEEVELFYVLSQKPWFVKNENKHRREFFRRLEKEFGVPRERVAFKNYLIIGEYIELDLND